MTPRGRAADAMVSLIDAGDGQCACWPFREMAGREFAVRDHMATDPAGGGPGCQEQISAEGGPEAHARARMRPRASTPSHRRPDVNSAGTAEKAGPPCGCACPAVGSHARTTRPTSTPEPTTRRPTIPSPSGCPAAQTRGVTSIDVRSEPDRHEVHVPDSRSRRLDLSSSASAAVRPTHEAPSTLLPGSSSL
jgi:hypothetical protein